MTDYSVHHAIPQDTCHAAASTYDPHFEEVISRVEDQQQILGFTAGPLEAHIEATDRFSRRLHQASALLMMLRQAESRGVFETLNDSIQEHYIQAIADLVDAAQIDGSIAIAETRPRR